MYHPSRRTHSRQLRRGYGSVGNRTLVTDPLNVLEAVAAAFAIIGGAYGAYDVARRKIRSRPYTEPMYLFAGTNELRDRLVKLRGRAVTFDTLLDFSVWNQLSNRIVGETEYNELLGGDASELNGKRLPIYITTKYKTLDSFASLIVALKDKCKLKFSYGGTGVIQVLLKGRFEVEVRAYAGPSVEITLREV